MTESSGATDGGHLPYLAQSATHPFWSDPTAGWTSRKAWSGRPFPIDGHHSLRQEK